jgi:hypothetical protein
MLWEPADKPDVLKAALEDVMVAVPMATPASRNVTVPDGEAPPVTATVNVTVPPYGEADALEDRVVVVAALCTDWVNAADVLAAFKASPEYDAVMEWDPADSADVLKLALPEERTAEPIVVVPSLNVTVPAGLLPVTVAVKLTAPPAAEGFALEARLVEVAAAFTICDNAGEALAVFLASPEYEATIEWAPVTRAELLQAALPWLPETVTVAVPSTVDPSLNVMEPLGEPPVTSPVQDTAWA